MLNVTDYIVIAFLLLFFIIGFKQGLLKTFLGPFSFFIGFIIGFVYYYKTYNFTAAILIIVMSTVLVNLIFVGILTLWKKFKGTGKDTKFSFTKLLAGIFNMGWQGLLLSFAILMIAVIPANAWWLEEIQDNILSSKSYALVSKWSDNAFSSQFDAQATLRVLSNPASVERIEKTEEFEEVMQNEKITRLLEDENIKAKIEKHDYWALLNNPKIQNVLNDKDLVKDLLDLNRRIIRESKRTPRHKAKSK